MNDHDCIVEMHSDIKYIIKDQKDFKESVLSNQAEFKAVFKDHDCKISKLKSWQNKASGMAIIISVMIPVVILVI